MKNPLLYTIYGHDPLKMTLRLLKEMDPVASLDKKTRIAVKPNLVTATPASHGATTHPEIVEGVLIYLQDRGFHDIRIMEGSWVGDSTRDAFAVCGYEQLSRKYRVPLVDLKADDTVTKKIHGQKIHLCRTMETVDYLINVPLVKGHCQTRITCALKNLKGVIPDSEKRRFHTLGLHRPIALLNALVPQHLIIADAVCPDPGFEEGGNPRTMNRIVAGQDPVAIDCYAAGILGRSPDEVPYIAMAAELGVGRLMQPDDPVVALGGLPDTDDAFEKIEFGKTVVLPEFAHEMDACSACKGHLTRAVLALHKEKYPVNPDAIAIGQGHSSSSGEAGQIGIGDCTGGFECHLPGCPPSMEEILAFLKK